MSLKANFYHKDLANSKWQKLNFLEQMAHLGSEVERAIKWRTRNSNYSQQAFFRALELLDFTIEDSKNKTKSCLRELCRLREVSVDYFFGDNIYKSSDKLWRKYFMFFAFAARNSLKSLPPLGKQE